MEQDPENEPPQRALDPKEIYWLSRAVRVLETVTISRVPILGQLASIATRLATREMSPAPPAIIKAADRIKRGQEFGRQKDGRSLLDTLESPGARQMREVNKTLSLTRGSQNPNESNVVNRRRDRGDGVAYVRSLIVRSQQDARTPLGQATFEARQSEIDSYKVPRDPRREAREQAERAVELAKVQAKQVGGRQVGGEYVGGS